VTSNLITTDAASGTSAADGHIPGGRELTVFRGPVWNLRIEGSRVAIVLQDAQGPGGILVNELVIFLPHVSFPFDFQEGIERFRHHRGDAEGLQLGIDSRVLLDWIHRASGGRLGGTAQDDTLVLAGRTTDGARYTARARLVSDHDQDQDEPTLVLSLYQVRVYGLVTEPWPVLAGRIIDLIPREFVVSRTLTTARLKVVQRALAWALTGLGWKLPSLRPLKALGVEVRDGRILARFARENQARRTVVNLDGVADRRFRGGFERFVEDLELKRHHGQVDRLLANQKVREALAEVYRAFDGPPEPGFLAERLIGISASQAILYDEGERVCRQLLRTNPTYEPALCGLASIALGRGRPEEAAMQLERLTGILVRPGDREDATAADLSVADILRTSAPGEAKAALERVLERSPDHEEALESLIAICSAEGDTRATLPLYKRLLFAARSTTRTRDAGLRLAKHALEQGQPEDARVFLHVVLEAAPNDIEALLALADVEAHDRHIAKAVKILEGALRESPRGRGDLTVRVIRKLARLALGELGDLHRARRVLWRGIDLDDVDVESALALARDSLEAREPHLVQRYLAGIQPDDEHYVGAQTLRAQALLQRGDDNAALDAVLEVLDREPQNADALALLADCTPDLNRREHLIHRLRQSLARVSSGGDRARIQHRVGTLFISLGLAFDAIEPLEEALDQAPDGPLATEIAEHLVALYVRFGMWDKHQALCRARLPRHGDPTERVAMLIRLGSVALSELGDPHAARPYLEEAIALAPRNLVALGLLRETLDALQQGIALVSVLTRLEALQDDVEARTETQIRLAELQLTGLESKGQARATLQRLPRHAGKDARVRGLRARVGLPTAGPATQSPQTRPPGRRPTGDPRYGEAVALADKNRLRDALTLLEAVLLDKPSHVPARELEILLRREIPTTSGGVSMPPSVAEPPRARPNPGSPATPAGGTATSTSSVPAPRVTDTQEFVAPPSRLGPRPVSQEGTPTRDFIAPPGNATASGIADTQPAIETAPLIEMMAESDTIDLRLSEAETAHADGDLAAARRAVEAALALDPELVVALERLIVILVETGDHRAHAEVCERLATCIFDAEAAAGYLRQAGALWVDRVGDPVRGMEAWRRYLTWRPLDEPVFERVVGFLEGTSRTEEAHALYEVRIEALEDVLRDTPDDPETLERLVRSLAATADQDAARVVLARLLPLMLDGPHKEQLKAIVEV
jgi:tetratricopeptide (TPR) repeat protein